MLRQILLLLGCTLPAFHPVSAQEQALFVDVSGTHLPGELPPTCMDVASGDADGDGDLDLVLAVEYERNALYVNDGRGSFTDASERLPDVARDSEDVEFTDVDADGDLDLVVVSERDGANELYLNDGSGRFADASDRLPVHGTSNALAVLDLDGEGSPDLLIGNYGPQGVMINDGDGRFSDGTARHWPDAAGETQDLELADVDADGDLDVVVANEGQNQLFINDAGRLVDETDSRLPTREDETREIRSGDVDGDGDLDLVVANVRLGLESPRQDRLLLNDGSGKFSDAESGRFPDGSRDHFTIQTVDLDGDGDLDIIGPASLFTGDALDHRVLLNDGSGTFTAAREGEILPLSVNGKGMGFDIEVGDFDGDGRDDLFFCDRSSSSNPRGGVVMRGRPSLVLSGWN